MSTRILSNNTKIFSGNSDSLLRLCCSVEKMSELTKAVKDEIKNTVVLYTKHIEEKYFEMNARSVKRSKQDHLDFVMAFTNHRQYQNLNPLTKMWLFVALNIPLAIVQMSLPQFNLFIEELFCRVDMCKKTHGDAVGIEAAQSCSERFTQSTLNSFHAAGAKKSALVGIKRIEEILDAYKKLNLPILGPIDTQYDVSKLFEKKLDDYCSESGVVYKPELSSEKRSDFLLFFKLNNALDCNEIMNSKYLSDIIKKDMFYKDGIIYFLLHKHASIAYYEIPMEKDAKYTTVPHHASMSYNRERERHISGLRDCVEYDVDDKLLFFKPKSSLVICTKSPFQDEPDKFKSNIDNDELLRYCPDINMNSIVSNDIYWIYSVLGITAVETYLTKEIKSVLGAEGMNINTQHINLIAANMTHRGEIRANKYSGLKNTNNVIRKATFQQGTETFAKAAAAGSIDNFGDVSSQILAGKLAKIGTAYCHIVKKVTEKTPIVFVGTPPDSPEYAPLSPEYAPPPFQPSSPEYAPSSPPFQPSSPPFQPSSPPFQPSSPPFQPSSPSFRPSSPIYEIIKKENIVIEPEIHI
jgi:hypothetical protein